MIELLKSLQSKAPTYEQTKEIFSLLIEDGENSATDAQIGAYLFSTATREIHADELFAAAQALRSAMVSLPVSSDEGILDTCGTGGSGLDTFNTSTISAFVCLGAGCRVAKHGNRAATSRTGSADVLEALGLRLNLEPKDLLRMFDESGFCFMFAPNHHPATKRVAGIRRQLGVRTIFNFLGPLCNPASARYQVLGVSKQSMMRPMIEALARLGSKRVMVVRGRDGLDEITLSASTDVLELRDDKISSYEISPEDFGYARVLPEELRGYEPEEAARISRDILNGQAGPLRDLVCLNAAASLYVLGVVPSLEQGIAVASQSIDSGSALSALERTISVSNSYD
jgi:anthranilate phosphoribosyltransferase